MKITKRQLRKLISEVFKKGLSTKAVRHMSGLDDDTISTIEDIESRGPEYQQQAQGLAIDMGSLEPEAYHYDMEQKGISLNFYKYHIIYKKLDQQASQFGPWSDRRFVFGPNLKKYAKATLGDKFEEIKYSMALNDLLKTGAITKKIEADWDAEQQSWSETYYAVK